VWINVKTGYTFGQVYGHLDQVAEKLARFGTSGGMADRNNTFGHVRWKKACDKAEIKPIYGVRLHVVNDLAHIRETKNRRHKVNEMTFIAKDSHGLAEIYELVNISGKKFYFQNLLEYSDIQNLSPSVVMFSGIAPDWDLMPHGNVYQEVGPHIPASIWKASEAPLIASIDNFYLDPWDKPVYEPFAADRKRERRTTMMHIPTPREWLNTCPSAEAFRNLQVLNEECNVELPFAPMVKYVGKDKIDIWCEKGAKILGVDITNPGEYRDRYHREIDLIKKKDYVDYFLVTADLIRYSKTKMAVGPGRGSAAGSLVCYLMGITTVDPIVFNLFFERFLDPGRFDAPDIDIDFQDDKRHLVMKYLSRKYGEQNVAQLGTVGLLKPKSAINLFSKALKLPFEATDEIKESIPEGSAGDSRKNKTIDDFFEKSDIGKRFAKEFPRMIPVAKIEGHPSHTGVHAAAIIVCNSPISKYAGILSVKNARIAMVDKKDAEVVNLLKIDALGLRTMTILAHVCDQIGKPYDWLYEIPLDDPGAFRVFADHRYDGIFQFEGSAVQGLANSMPIESLEDISALCAIGRPGPMGSGAAVKFCRVRRGAAPVTQLSDHPLVIEICKKTFGMIIYQETMLELARRYGKFSWGECGKLRKGVSKSMGAEFFSAFKEKFISGAVNNGDTEEAANIVWEGIQTMGGYAFNKSHSVCYGLISYLCAYMKAHHPLEFVVANLNNAKNNMSARKILRDGVEKDDLQWCHFDRERSDRAWTVHDGVIYGGLCSIDGMGPAKANKVLKARRDGSKLTPAIEKAVSSGITPFKYLWPGREVYGDIYENPQAHGLNGAIHYIKDCKGDGTFTFIGCLLFKQMKDENAPEKVSQRGGKYLTKDSQSINLRLEDDTGEMVVKIKRQDYLRFGKEIAERGKEEKDWYMIHGKKINGWGILFVENIKKITREWT